MWPSFPTQRPLTWGPNVSLVEAPVKKPKLAHDANRKNTPTAAPRKSRPVSKRLGGIAEEERVTRRRFRQCGDSYFSIHALADCRFGKLSPRGLTICRWSEMHAGLRPILILFSNGIVDAWGCANLGCVAFQVILPRHGEMIFDQKEEERMRRVPAASSSSRWVELLRSFCRFAMVVETSLVVRKDRRIADAALGSSRRLNGGKICRKVR